MQCECWTDTFKLEFVGFPICSPVIYLNPHIIALLFTSVCWFLVSKQTVCCPQEIRNHKCSYEVAKFPENRNRNRYRDVSPCEYTFVHHNLNVLRGVTDDHVPHTVDHSRVRLESTENDYINASLVLVEEAQRSYILTQASPRLSQSSGHTGLHAGRSLELF